MFKATNDSQSIKDSTVAVLEAEPSDTVILRDTLKPQVAGASNISNRNSTTQSLGQQNHETLFDPVPAGPNHAFIAEPLLALL